MKKSIVLLLVLFCFPLWASAQARLDSTRLAALMDEAEAEVQHRAKFSQVMVDMIFSFSELGMQEVETSRYITGILEENGFAIERDISDIPTAWWATWGSGEPVIALGSDIDCIPKASQKPGVAYHDPLIEGAPGHGEGHNSGQALNVTAAIVLKEIMEREGLPGTLVLWPGVAEEQLGSKAWFVRDGHFEDVDVVLFTHVSRNLSVSYGQGRGTGLVSVEFSFEGEAAHGAGAPWRGRSALDAVELMNVTLAESLAARAGTAALTVRTAPIRSTSKLPFQEASSTPLPPLGLETRMSRPPSSAMASPTKPSSASLSPTSTARPTTR